MEKSLKDLIARLPIPGLKESTDRHIIAEKISELLHVPVKPKQIMFKDGIITVAVPPVMKSALHLKEEALLAALGKMDINADRVR